MTTASSLREKVAKQLHESRRRAGLFQSLWEYEPSQIHTLYLNDADAAISAVLEALVSDGVVEAVVNTIEDNIVVGCCTPVQAERYEIAHYALQAAARKLGE